MKKRSATILAVAAVATALTAVPVTASADWNRSKDDLFAVGLAANGTKLAVFDTDRPKRIRAVGSVYGLQGDDARLVGIDFRVQDSKLYGVGNAGGIYTFSGRNGTLVGQLTVPLDGTAFGVDFNPAANALRVVSNTGQNLRQPFAMAGPTAMDATLIYPATPTTPVTTATGVTGAAYTNNDLSTDTATTLYDIDTNLDQVVIQSPANAGLLAATGKLGVDAGTEAGFDIYSTVRDGRTVDVMGFATLQASGSSRLYEINLFTGQATDQGRFPFVVTDIAIPLNQL